MHAVRFLSLLLALPAQSLLLAQDDHYAQLAAGYQAAIESDPTGAAATFVAQFAEAALQRAGSEAAVPFLLWIVRHGGLGDPVTQAVETLARQHGKSPELVAMLERLPCLAPYLGDAVTGPVLEQVIAVNDHPEVQAQARFARASLMQSRVGSVEDSELAAAAADLDQARKLTKDPALAARVQALTVGRRGLTLGDAVPEIAGLDLDGVPLRLSDYRGKVVVLDFWGDW